MGAREDFETVTRVIQAFAGQRTWCQAELARHIGIEARRLRKVLINLQSFGMPLEREDEHPHVYWSVPVHWFPGGVIFDIADWPVLVHAVLRIADPKRREKLIGRLLAGKHVLSSTATGVERLNQAVAATPIGTEEHEKLLVVERSLLEEVPLSIYYYSAGKGQLGWRIISPQMLFTQPHGRICAYCHTNSALRWFRVDNIQRVHLEPEKKRQNVDAEQIQEFVSSSVDGYNDGSDEELAFRVRSPESGWVKRNLLAGMSVDKEAEGESIRIVARGASLIVARYIVGLGGAGVAESQHLKALVRQLAESAVEANQ